MNHLLGLALVVIMGIVGIGFYNESVANRVEAEARARATLIKAEAEADSLRYMAMTPMLAVIFFGGAGAIGAIAFLVFAAKYRPNRPQVIERITERHIIYLQPGLRRELWQQLANGKPAMVIDARSEVSK